MVMVLVVVGAAAQLVLPGWVALRVQLRVEGVAVGGVVGRVHEAVGVGVRGRPAGAGAGSRVSWSLARGRAGSGLAWIWWGLGWVGGGWSWVAGAQVLCPGWVAVTEHGVAAVV